MEGLVSKAQSGVSDEVFRTDLAEVLRVLPEMDLTDDEALIEALWSSALEAYRAGWEMNRTEDEL